MVRTAHFRMVDRLLEGTLAESMERLYDETGSWEDVSRRLFSEWDVTVSGQTLRRWARILGIGEKVA